MTTDSFDEAIAGLDEAVGDLGKAVSALAGIKAPPKLDASQLVRMLESKWSREKRPSSVEGDKPPPRTSPFSVEYVLARWQEHGASWLASCTRLEARAAVIAAKHEVVGPRLLADPAFWPALMPRMRERQANQILNAGYFITGHLSWIEQEIRARAESDPDAVSPWWVDPGPDVGLLASKVASLGATVTYAEVLGQLGLPDKLSEAFLAEVARSSQATSAQELDALLRFLDRDREMGNTALVFESTLAWVRRAVLVGGRNVSGRLKLAELLRRRIGDVVASRDDARWVGIEAERRAVRTWLIGEIFRVLFSHLVPDGDHSHMTEPRRKFWARYDQCVEKIWLLICDDHKDRMDGDEAVSDLKKHGLLEVLRFTGQAEQDGLWMQLRTDRGEIVTVLEGNAITTLRLQRGAFTPPISTNPKYRGLKRTVEYDDAKALFTNAYANYAITHRGNWQWRAKNDLSELLVYPSGDR